MKKPVLFLAMIFALILSSCSRRIADLTQVSTRNMDKSKEYVELQRGVKGRDTQLHSILLLFGPLGAPDIEEAIDDAVAEVPGGEYMENVVIKEKRMQFILFSLRSFKVEGDVYGIQPDTTALNH